MMLVVKFLCYAEGTTGGALPCSIMWLVLIAGNTGSEMIDESGGRKTTTDGGNFAIRWATVILFLRDSCSGALMVTEIYTLGISADVKENGDTTRSENNNMWDHHLFITSPVPIETSNNDRMNSIKT
jgi:hypothetical protein